MKHAQGQQRCPPQGGNPLLYSLQLPGKPQGITAERTWEIISFTHTYLLSICVVSDAVLTLKKTGSERLKNLSKVRQIVKDTTSTEKLAFQLFITRDRKRMCDRNELRTNKESETVLEPAKSRDSSFPPLVGLWSFDHKEMEIVRHQKTEVNSEASLFLFFFSPIKRNIKNDHISLACCLKVGFFSCQGGPGPWAWQWRGSGWGQIHCSSCLTGCVHSQVITSRRGWGWGECVLSTLLFRFGAHSVI